MKLKHILDDFSRVSVNKIFKNHWNPNRMSEALFEKEKNSIRKFGFIVPLVVRKVDNGFELIDGEHRLAAAVAEGFEELPINNLGHVPDEQAKQLTLILNMHGEPRRDLLQTLMADLEKKVSIDELLENLPMSDSEIRNLLTQSPIDWANLSATEPTGVVGADGGGMNGGPAGEGSGASGDDPDKKVISVTVPDRLHRLFFEQIDRISALITPESSPERLSPAPALQIMVEIVKAANLQAFLDARKRQKKQKTVRRVTKKRAE